MNTTITVAEGILFCLILLLGGCIAARTGRLLWAVMTVWLSLVLISMPLASVNMAWVEAYAKAGTARSSAVERDRLHELVNLFPDGTHVLASLTMGWFYGIVAGVAGLRFRRSRKAISRGTIPEPG